MTRIAEDCRQKHWLFSIKHRAVQRGNTEGSGTDTAQNGEDCAQKHWLFSIKHRAVQRGNTEGSGTDTEQNGEEDKDPNRKIPNKVGKKMG
jgi:hypothetical protein